ncbi:NAD-dependent epimerase/dehydratase family protein [Pseudonocardia sp. KRD-184]|uniref:NAD-dependent epimerase/dehydratase family protein n=1 Tax=Pseudonocardia oceani TaxID=2792013 RepID=A0ABS6U6Y2_9PSEU|nr:NAD-dependent epimerase/dehydratase family protein [Pseudonocardia oceani]MBW0088895.1 NAD-dependent epimerase/dehydratase family protein [Pseudonocardia oceani]MBW0095876.1 NAD-dependent epimerase/dehydratase family protein [Pseudonocardia oceani]MBW0108659.1 NAD-dependent epimerase/dehydratase family protein [Pseudonocardia oceani]MBW0122595.1 NAD-dependent epimerase/dehydratase family protein [Pseudonocardia oceani]MBW0127721.1 NAD-dependent epimerase/dehydratase family protein [Pseudono
MSARSVLVTGGAGFIGSRLAARLHEAGDRVSVVDSLHPQVHATGEWPALLPAGVERVLGDVTDPALWDALLPRTRPDVVVHLAAETGTGQSLTEASRHGMVNVVGATRLLDGLTRHRRVPRALVLPSSRAVYGEGAWADAVGRTCYPPARDAGALEAGRWDPELQEVPARPLAHSASTTEPRPTNIYAATKLAQEHLLGAWAAAHGCTLSVLRLQNVYGPGQSLTNPYTGIVTLFARLGLHGEGIEVFEDGRILRDFVYVDDVVSALVAASALDDGARTTVDVGSGEPVTLLDLAERIAGLCGAPAPRVSGRYRAGDVRAAHADLAAAAERLGYHPTVTLDSGLRRLLTWIAAETGVRPPAEVLVDGRS